LRTPKRLQPLVDNGHIEEVLSQLMSGKEADVFVVLSEGEICCAKVYKEANKRSFHQQSVYQEGRKGRHSSDARALKKGSKYGKKLAESSWQSAEVDALFKLHAIGVRVPRPFVSQEGVLLMELITDAEGEVAPRLNDIDLTPELAMTYHRHLVREAVKMLCAGLIHGDYSEFNILIDAEGPVIIDLPQAINALTNNNAQELFIRDVDHLGQFFGTHVPELKKAQFGKEIWDLFVRGKLRPDTELTGLYVDQRKEANVQEILTLIEDEKEEPDAFRTRRKVRKTNTPI
jgi:RIO kinase 1